MMWLPKSVPFLILLGGCGSEPNLSGPAPVGALQCVIDHGRAAGYEVSDGSVQRGFVRLTRRLPPPPVDAQAAQPRPDLADVVLDRSADQPVENQILAVHYEGQLELTLSGFDDEGSGAAPGQTVEDHATTLLALCTDPSTPPSIGGDESTPVDG